MRKEIIYAPFRKFRYYDYSHVVGCLTQANKQSIQIFTSALLDEYNSSSTNDNFDALATRDKLISNALKGETSPVRIKALQDAAEPFVVAYRKVLPKPEDFTCCSCRYP